MEPEALLYHDRLATVAIALGQAEPIRGMVEGWGPTLANSGERTGTSVEAKDPSACQSLEPQSTLDHRLELCSLPSE